MTEIERRKRRRAATELLRALVAAVGSQERLATIMRTSQPTVSRLLRGDMDVSAEAAVRIEAELGVPVETLRPDIPWHVLRSRKNAPPYQQRKTVGA